MPLIAEVGRKKLSIKLLLLIISVFLWLGVVIHLFPVWWMISGSLKDNFEIYQMPPTLWPKNPFWGIYHYIWTDAFTFLLHPLQVYLKNSGIYVGIIMLTRISISALAGYSLSKLYSAKWSKLLFLFFVGVMLVPPEIFLIPSYMLLRHFPFATAYVPMIPFGSTPLPSVNFIGTYWAVILPGMVGAFSVLLFKGFFDTIPNELINAARLDGASELKIFAKIIIPFSKPIFAVVSYFTFVSVWNSFTWPFFVLGPAMDKWPLSVAIYHLQSISLEGGPGKVSSLLDPALRVDPQYLGVNLILALSIIESIPAFIMFIIFREQLMSGIKIKGFK